MFLNRVFIFVGLINFNDRLEGDENNILPWKAKKIQEDPFDITLFHQYDQTPGLIKD